MIIRDNVLEKVEYTDIKNGSFVIPKGVTSIGRNAFLECSSLTSITIPESVTSIGDYAFFTCRELTQITIPKSVTSIGKHAFDGCKGLTKITIPESVTSIENYLFYECSGLTSITIQEGVTDIGNSAFFKCSGLTEITIPKSLIYIGDSAFLGCSGLTQITIPDNVIEVYGLITYNSLEYDKDKKTIILKQDKPSEKHKFIPSSYLKHLFLEGKTGTFLSNADFRHFNSHIPNLNELMVSALTDEEQMDFFKFAVCLGCFSKKKMLDKNGRETEVTVGQKASALLAQLIKTPYLQIGSYHGLFDSLPFNAETTQEFLKFITPQGKKNDNLELLIKLEHECPGIFSRVMTDFEKAKGYKTTLSEDGKNRTWEEALKLFYNDNKYAHITEENKDIAEVYSSIGGITQAIFDKASELRKTAREEGVSEHILGKEIREQSILEKIEEVRKQTSEELENAQTLIEDLYKKQFTYEWLSKNDPRNGILGQVYVNCCGTLNSVHYGRLIAEASITAKNVQNLVVRDSKGEIISKGTMYVDEEHGYAVFNDFELNSKYRKGEHRTESGIYQGDDKDESELSESEKKQREDRDLIFAAFQRGIQAFVEEYDLQHPNCPMKQINVGMGYNRLKRNVTQFEEATELLTVPAEYGFKDAETTQYVLYKRDDEKEKKKEEER